MERLPIHQQITFVMVRDLAATAHFYGELLNLSLTVDQGSCHIYRVVGDAYLGFCQRPEQADSTNNVILTLVTPEVDGWYQQLQAQGVSFEKPPAVNPTYNIYHCFARDPDGYLVEIQRFLDPVLTRLPAGSLPEEVASAHYRGMAEEDRELWLATLRERYRQTADRRGSTPDTWWNAGRRMVAAHSHTYQFDRVDRVGETEVKLFFRRIKPDGTQQGMPVPIQLFQEEGEWRVKMVTY